eukprot:scaffold507054_cov13-Prasinocladus_malaysianus.AAC.1
MAPIVVGTRVSARRGPWLGLQPGQRRQQRARIFGFVREAVGSHRWLVEWDNETTSTEASTCLKTHEAAAGLPPPDGSPNRNQSGLQNVDTRIQPIPPRSDDAGAPFSGKPPTRCYPVQFACANAAHRLSSPSVAAPSSGGDAPPGSDAPPAAGAPADEMP